VFRVRQYKLQSIRVRQGNGTRHNKVSSLAFALYLAATSSSTGNAQIAKESRLPCSDVTMLNSQPLSALPPLIQEEILSALKPSILSFAKATADNLEEDFRLHKIKLDALQVSQTDDSGALYVVHWGLSEFGVNGAIWIVEVNSHGARNLIAAGDETVGTGSFGGWGMQVLSRQDNHYPEIMFASKGFAQDGGAEAEGNCARRVAGFYKSVPCPADCLKNLNAR
jgi:hypothetical protein